jgi:hypothetical protein
MPFIAMQQLYREQGQLQIVKGVQHPGQRGLISQPTNQSCHLFGISPGSWRDGHTTQTVGPGFIQRALNTNALGAWPVERKVFSRFWLRHR